MPPVPRILAAAFVALTVLAAGAAIAGVYALTTVPTITCTGHKGC
jgi:hypothetical protein